MTSVPHSGAKSVTPGGSVAGGAGHTLGPWTIIPARPHEEIDGAFEAFAGIEGADGSPVCVFGDAGGHGSSSIGGDASQMRGLSEAQRQPGHRAALSGGSGVHLGLVDPASGGCRMGPEGFGHIYQPDGSSSLEWLYCHDGRWRPTEPGLSPLTDADSGRMGRLHGYGDAIDVEAFTNLIGAYLDAAPSPWRQAA